MDKDYDIVWDGYEEDYEPLEDTECYSLADFIDLIDDGLMFPDWGGITDILVDGEKTKYHLGYWMLHRLESDSISISLDELRGVSGKVMIEWANK